MYNMSIITCPLLGKIFATREKWLYSSAFLLLFLLHANFHFVRAKNQIIDASFVALVLKFLIYCFLNKISG